MDARKVTDGRALDVGEDREYVWLHALTQVPPPTPQLHTDISLSTEVLPAAWGSRNVLSPTRRCLSLGMLKVQQKALFVKEGVNS